jgi:hypothetical protein
MSNTNQGSNKLLLLTAVLCCCVTAALAITAFWQHGVSNDKADEAAKHEATATLFQEAEAEGQAAGQALQAYVQTGDESVLQQINDHTAAGVNKLTAAVQQSGISGQAFLDGGTQLVQAEGQIIALRQAGDMQGAAAGLQALSEQFNSFLERQTQVITSERTSAASLMNESDQASDSESWLTIGAGLFGLGAVATGLIFVFRSASRRRQLDAMPSA